MSLFDRFESDGWLKVGGVFDLQLIDSLRSDCAEQSDRLMAADDGHRGYIRVGDNRIQLSITLRGPFLDARLYANPMVIALVKRFLGDNIVIDSFTCVTALPGAGEQPLHSDHPDLFQERPELSAEMPPFAITVAIPLIDLTDQTGATKVFPGSHKHQQNDRSELSYPKRGDCYLMDYRLLHQGTQNLTDEPRPIIYIVYARHWFTDITNFRRQPRLSIARDSLVAIPVEHQPLFRRLAAKGAVDLSQKELFPTL